MTTNKAIFGRLALIGGGLIGSSVARAAKAAGAADFVAIADTDAHARAVLRKLSIGDAVCDTPEEAVLDADLTIVATPVGAFDAVGAAIAGAQKPGSILSDVGSVKQHVIAALRPHIPTSVHLIPAHPVAGTEQSGPQAGFAKLFCDRWCIITPPPDADPAAVEQLAAFWRRLGSMIEIMTAERHDRVLAMTSHLPHLIAYTIVGTANDLESVDSTEVLKFSAGGFRDFTRIAASDPTMWRDVFLTNKSAVLELLGRFTEDLIALQRAIRWDEGDTLFHHFEQTRAVRRGVLEQGQDVDAPDFGRGVVQNA